MEFIKKQKLGFYVSIVAAALSIISLCIYVSNVNKPYYQDMNTKIVVIMVASIVLLALGVVASQFSGTVTKIVADAARVAAAVLVILSGMLFLGMRVESFGYIFGSNLELGNDAAFVAGNQAIQGIIFFVITWVVSIIAVFCDIKKKNA